MKILVRCSHKSVYTLTVLTILMVIVAGTTSARSAWLEPDGKKKARTADEVEIRFEFSPKGPFADLTEYYSVFMVINHDGNARALRYGLRYQTKNVAAYEGVFSEAEVQRLFARVRAAFRLPKYRKDYARWKVYEDNSFYLGLKSHRGKVKEMLGGDGPKPDEVRSLIAEMSELWKKLREVPSAYAYLTSRPIEKDRLKRLRREYKVSLTPIESLPASLQSLLIPVVTQARNFYPLTQAQYDQYQRYHRPLTYKGAGYEPEVLLAANELELKK